jgi:hypothetical protein
MRISAVIQNCKTVVVTNACFLDEIFLEMQGYPACCTKSGSEVNIKERVQNHSSAHQSGQFWSRELVYETRPVFLQKQMTPSGCWRLWRKSHAVPLNLKRRSQRLQTADQRN